MQELDERHEYMIENARPADGPTIVHFLLNTDGPAQESIYYGGPKQGACLVRWLARTC